MAVSKSGLAILLSRLQGFQNPSKKSEQYVTDSETAAEVLWEAKMQGDIERKKIVDLGTGTGVLALGAAALGASEVVGVDNDIDAIQAARQNLEALERDVEVNLPVRFSFDDITRFSETADTVMQNPPFGTSLRHADRKFLEKAIRIAPVVWSFHKLSTRRFVERFAETNGYDVTRLLEFDLPLKRTMAHHRKRIHRIAVGCWRLERKT